MSPRPSPSPCDEAPPTLESAFTSRCPQRARPRTRSRSRSRIHRCGETGGPGRAASPTCGTWPRRASSSGVSRSFAGNPATSAARPARLQGYPHNIAGSPANAAANRSACWLPRDVKRRSRSYRQLAGDPKRISGSVGRYGALACRAAPRRTIHTGVAGTPAFSPARTRPAVNAPGPGNAPTRAPGTHLSAPRPAPRRRRAWRWAG
jgi:hypothetical protein